jgi:hypothetical protein
MAKIIDGTPVDASTTNAALLGRQSDDSMTGVLTLANTDPASGAQIDNLQREVNSLDSFTGQTGGSVYNNKPTYSANEGFSSNEDLRTRVDGVSAKFNSTSGHAHTGTSGDGPQIQSSNIASVQLHGVIISGTDLTSVTGSSYDISSLMTGKIPSNSVTTKGVVVNNPYNQVPLKDQNGNILTKAANPDKGATIYGRITESSGVWTLSFYYLASGVETSTSLSAVYVKWYFQQLINPIADAGFVYSDQIFIPSDNATADIIYATETEAGKVMLASTAPADPAAVAAKGTSTTVAKSDHVHQGVHSISASSALYGDVTFSSGTGINLNQVGQNIEIQNTGSAVGYGEQPAGPRNGVNVTFGPLTYTPTNNQSIAVFLDGVYQEPSLWSLVGLSVVFTTAPAAGQRVDVWYLTNGAPPTPPPPSGTLITEFRTLTGTESSNKKIVLGSTPATPGYVLVDVIGGTAQEFNVDYTVVGNEVRWTGYALDGLLATGDKLRVHYQS